MARTAARESLFKLIYEYTIREEIDELTLGLFLQELNEDDALYVTSSYRGIIAAKDELIEQIGRFSRGFATDRIYKIDMAILMVAIYEIRYRDDIPDSVSVNEAIELTKIYSTDKSRSFVNGLLSSVIKEKNNAG